MLIILSRNGECWKRESYEKKNLGMYETGYNYHIKLIFYSKHIYSTLMNSVGIIHEANADPSFFELHT